MDWWPSLDLCWHGLEIWTWLLSVASYHRTCRACNVFDAVAIGYPDVTRWLLSQYCAVEVSDIKLQTMKTLLRNITTAVATKLHTSLFGLTLDY